jgi:CBS domain containing-hemolysin-like protein
MTRSDLEAMARVSTKEGILHENENRVFRNLLRLPDLQVTYLMTPRTVIAALPQDMTVGEALQKLSQIPYSRIPLYIQHLDDAMFYVLRTSVFEAALRGEHATALKNLGRPLHAVPESKTVSLVLEEMMLRKEHIFLLIDEYGGTAGLITLEDLLESLLGIEITDETDLVADLQQLALERYKRKKEEQQSQLGPS